MFISCTGGEPRQVTFVVKFRVFKVAAGGGAEWKKELMLKIKHRMDDVGVLRG